MRTFLRVFPDATLWSDGTLLVGTRKPLRLDPVLFEKKVSDTTRSGPLASSPFATVELLLESMTAGPDALQRFVGPGPILTDDRPLIEFFRSLPANEASVSIDEIRAR